MHHRKTPIEAYDVSGRNVFVKRDDLFATDPYPPLAKLRGLRILLEKLKQDDVGLVGCWDTRISKLGQGLAACCADMDGMKCIVSYPTRKNTGEPAAIDRARQLGAEVYPVPGGRLTICFARAREYVEGKGGYMLPFGFECDEAVEGVRRGAARVPARYYEDGTIVLSCGSGVTLSGLLNGLKAVPARIIALSSGRSVNRIVACLKRHLPAVPDYVEIHECQVPYSTALDYPCPFPTHPHYDLKAWKMLNEQIDQLPPPILFWNIGA